MAKRKRLTAEDEIQRVLSEFEEAHPTAQSEFKRYNSASIRIRIIDPRYESMSRVDRNDEFWKFMERLSDDAFTQITMLILITPDERASSFANLEYEQPSPSLL